MIGFTVVFLLHLINHFVGNIHVYDHINLPLSFFIQRHPRVKFYQHSQIS